MKNARIHCVIKKIQKDADMSLSPSNISTLFGQYPTCDSITDVIATFHQPKILYELCAKEIAGDPIPNTTEHKTLHGILFKNTLQEEVIKKCIEQVKDVSGSLPLTKEIVWEVLRAPTSYMEHSRNRKSEDPLYAQCFHHFLREVFAFGENLMGFYGMLNEVIFANNSTHVEIREIPTFFQKKEMNEKKPLENQCVPCGSTEKISTYVWIGSISINVVSVVATVFFFFLCSSKKLHIESKQVSAYPFWFAIALPYKIKSKFSFFHNAYIDNEPLL